MELESLKFRNFKPRENVELDSHRALLEALEGVSYREGKLKAVVTDEGPHFFVSMVAYCDGKFFNSEVHYTKARLWGYPRSWQVHALQKVLKDILKQINRVFSQHNNCK